MDIFRVVLRINGRPMIKKSVALFLLLAFVFVQQAQAFSPIYTSMDNVAVGGYDPVSYFMQGGPVQGQEDLTLKWNGALWRFQSAANRDAFQQNPTRYAPQYGGYCAFAVSQGGRAPGDPLQWHIEDGKLYLNVNARIRERWLAKRHLYIPQADQVWQGWRQ